MPAATAATATAAVPAPLRVAATRAHASALRSLVQSVYPTASVHMLTRPPSRVARNAAATTTTTAPPQQHQLTTRAIVHEAGIEQLLTRARALDTRMRHSVHDDDSSRNDDCVVGRGRDTTYTAHARVSCCEASPSSLWRALYTCAAPAPPHLQQQPRRGHGGGSVCDDDDAACDDNDSSTMSPLCAWTTTTTPRTPEAVVWLPCWTPHAIVCIGGVEATDVARIVAPRLFDEVPDYDSVPCDFVAAATAATRRSDATAATADECVPLPSGRLPRYLREAMQRAALTTSNKASTTTARDHYSRGDRGHAGRRRRVRSCDNATGARDERRRVVDALWPATCATPPPPPPLFLRKGCALHDDMVLELSVPVYVTRKSTRRHGGDKKSSTSLSPSSPSPAAAVVRVRTLVTIANPNATVHDVCAERDATRRAFLRGCLGYARRVLHDALPHAVVDAVHLLLRHTHATTTTTMTPRVPPALASSRLCGSDTASHDTLATCVVVYWLSLLGHLLDGDEGAREVHATLTSMQRATSALSSSSSSQHEVLQRVYECLFVAPAPLTCAQTRVLSLVLARTAARVARSSSSLVDLSRRAAASNYFLPGEHLLVASPMEYVIVSNVAEKVSLHIDDDMTVGDVRALVCALLDVDEAHDVAMTYNGRLLRQDELTWPRALAGVANNNNSSNSTTASVPRKIFCRVTPRAAHDAGGVDALRVAAAAVQQQRHDAVGERERRAAVASMEPMIDMMTQNPAFLDAMLSASPQMKQLLERHPDMRRELLQPETLRMLMRAELDPAYRAQLGRDMELQLAQLNLIPGAQQMLDHHVQRVLDDLDPEGVRSAADLQAASEAHARPEAGKTVNADALPNPWAAATAPAPPPQQQQQQQQRTTTLPWASLLGSSSARAAVTPAAPAPPPPPTTTTAIGRQDDDVQRSRYAAQLQLLADMGFADAALCLRALQAADGDVEAAVAYIAQWQEDAHTP